MWYNHTMKSTRAFTLVEIMIVVAIIALLAAIAVPSLLEARKTANEAFAKSTVRSLSTASEIHLTQRHAYPASVTELTDFILSAPAYCVDGAGSTTGVKGYSYSCTLASNGYTFVAAPLSASQGTMTFTCSTGGVLISL
jgi:type IV pilus assembly protein PilA